MISKGYNGKISDIAELAPSRHRTSITRFLSNSNWDEKLLERALKSYIIELIWSKSRESKHPIYFIIDDTISEKTKPSSKAKNPIEKCSFHNSHLKGKNVYGHQILVYMYDNNNEAVEADAILRPLSKIMGAIIAPAAIAPISYTKTFYSIYKILFPDFISNFFN